MGQASRRQRIRGLPWGDVALLVVGAALVGMRAATDSGVGGFVGWVILVASAVLVVMGLLARGAAK